MKKKRIRFEVQPCARGLRWQVTHGKSVIYRTNDKLAAVRQAVFFARASQPSELIIKGRSGRIGKGSSGRRTYGADPERTRG